MLAVDLIGVCVFAATYELVTLVRKIQVMSGASGEMNWVAAVWNGFGSATSALMWPGPNAMISAYEQNTYRIPLITTVPITASGTLRRGLRVSSASGAAASNPPKASTARENAMKMSLVPDPPGQWNGVVESPCAPPLASTAMARASSSTTSNA